MIESIKPLGLMVNRDYFLIKNEFEEQEEGELICLAFKPENYKEISEIVNEISQDLIMKKFIPMIAVISAFCLIITGCSSTSNNDYVFGHNPEG